MGKVKDWINAWSLFLDAWLLNYHRNGVNGTAWGIIYLVTLAWDSLVESLQGYKPLPLPMGPYYGTIIPAANTELMIEYWCCKQSRNIHTELRMKVFVDKHRTERQSHVGNWVHLKLLPYRQKSIAAGRNVNLASKFHGPYQATKDQCHGL